LEKLSADHESFKVNLSRVAEIRKECEEKLRLEQQRFDERWREEQSRFKEERERLNRYLDKMREWEKKIQHRRHTIRQIPISNGNDACGR